MPGLRRSDLACLFIAGARRSWIYTDELIAFLRRVGRADQDGDQAHQDESAVVVTLDSKSCVEATGKRKKPSMNGHALGKVVP